jgi:hypothetical protein
MAITAKQLADGQIPTVKTVIYTCPTGAIAYVKTIICQNVGANTNTTALFLLPTVGASRTIAQVKLKANETLYFDEPLVLDATDAIQGLATNSLQVDYTIYGAEEA